MRASERMQRFIRTNGAFWCMRLLVLLGIGFGTYGVLVAQWVISVDGQSGGNVSVLNNLEIVNATNTIGIGAADLTVRRIIPVQGVTDTETTLTSNPQIAPGATGQEIVTCGAHASRPVRLVDGNGLDLTPDGQSVVLSPALPCILWYYTGTAWKQQAPSQPFTLQGSFDQLNGNTITNAVCGTREVRAGLTNSYLKLCHDTTRGPIIEGVVSGGPSDILFDAQATKDIVAKTSGLDRLIIQDTGATQFTNTTIEYGSGTNIRKSIALQADALYMQGACTLTTDQPLMGTGLIEPYIICSGLDADGFHRSIEMPDAWSGGQITVMLAVTNLNAAPANNYAIDFSAACVGNAVAYGSSISTTGEQLANVDFDANSSCGVPACAQGQKVRVTTASITPNGSCSGTGRTLRLQGQLNDLLTTTTQAIDVRVLGVKVEYAVNNASD